MDGLVTLFGGSGFIGRQTVRALAKAGRRVRVAVRNPGRGYRLRMLGDVGQIEVFQANIRNPASVRRALVGAEGCVNLVGVLYESGRQGFQSLHAMGAKTVAEGAKAEGVRHLVQVSAIGADEHSPSKYARTKAMGEAAARSAFAGAVIVRPSVVFGPEDNFFNRFGQIAGLSPVMPVVGGSSRVQPVYVGDVAAALARAVSDPACAGRTYELGGPGVFTYHELMALILRETQRNRPLLPLPWPAASAIGGVGDLVAPFLPPPLTSDQVEMLKLDNVVAPGAAGLEALGVTPTSVEAVVSGYLWRYRKGGQYAEAPAAIA